MVKKILLLSCFLFSLFIAKGQQVSQQDKRGLKDYYRGFFPIGVAVSPGALKVGDEAELIKKQFSSLTAEDAPGETIYRNTNWYKIVGEEYVANAFEYAHAADPDALLFYNDYNTIFPGKRERIFQLVKGLLDKGVPIHGIGMQGHWSVTTPIAAELENTITKFASLGLTVQLTELDISIHDKGESRRELTASDTTTFTAEKEQKQADQYALIMEILRKNKKNISGVTFWNISDRHSWLDNFPVKGRKDYPLLFDQNLQPKKAYWRVVDF
jgi:endo-1,4-beta-xylanase